MVNYGAAVALLVLLTTPCGQSFLSQSSHQKKLPGIQYTTRQVSVSQPIEYINDDGICLKKTIRNVTETCLDTLSKAVEAVDDDEETAIAIKRKVVKERTTGNYEVTLSLRSSKEELNLPLSETIGVSLCQTEQGDQVSDMHLNMDSLKFQRMGFGTKSDFETLDVSTMKEKLQNDFRGIVVSAVKKGGQGWKEGIRVGDVLTATSATVGGAIWPKTTLDGVKSAMASRRVASESMTFQFQRFVQETVVDNQFELSLSKPIGLEIQETRDGYVEVIGFNTNAPRLVRYAVQVGDRIVAVDSSLGDNMWPVSTVEGVISACTSRLPGQPVRMKFRRPVVSSRDGGTARLASTQRAELDAPPTTVENEVENKSAMNQRERLLNGCKTALQRYMKEQKQDNKKRFAKKYPVSAMVADKVLDAVASASISMDSGTLHMVMTAYLSSRQANAAIKAFEAATGINSDGSSRPATMTIAGKESGSIQASLECLDLYTVSSLMQAHSIEGDLIALKRVLAALEGAAGAQVGGVEVGHWLGVGETIKPDTTTYNIALDAIAKSGGRESLDELLDVFESMDGTSKPARDVVSYNIVIDALTRAGRSDDAFDTFNRLKKSCIRPDKYTFTALIKSCVKEGDMQELLYSMREQGVQPDVVTFNNMIRLLCDRLQWYEAKKMITIMENMGIKPDSMTYGMLMTGLLKAKKYSSCLVLFETACSDPSTAPLTENVYVYTSAVSAAAALGNYEKAFELINRMSVLAIRPNIKTLTALMSACMTSGKPALALDVFRKISKPDGLALKKGIEAHCMNGGFHEACGLLATQRGRGAKMSGKQLMIAYTDLVNYALKAEDYTAAREGFTQFLKSGLLPSKVMFRTMAKAMRLNQRNKKLNTNIREEVFDFLLFVVDALKSRSLACDGTFYTTILMTGAQMGGLRRKIAFLMAEARGRTVEEDSNEEGISSATIAGWEELIQNYDSFKSEIGESIQLPSMNVRAGSGQIRQIMFAEQAVSYDGKQKRRVKRSGVAQMSR